MKRIVLSLLILFSLMIDGITLFSAAADDDFKEVSKTERIEAATTVKLEAENSAYKDLKLTVQQGSIIITLILLIAGNLFFFLKKYRFRYITLLISLAILGFYQAGCACSVGASVKIFVNIIMNHHPVAAALLLGIPVIFTFFSGRVFCGHVCPIGAVQEFLTIKEKSTFTISQKIEKRFRLLRWIVLAGLVIASLSVSHYIFEDIDPYRAIFSLKGNVLQWSLAAILLTAGLFINRPFCRYLCPLAVWLKIAAKFSLFKIKKNDLTCTNCSLCKKSCPVNAIDENCSIDDAECIRCGRCIEACPKNSLCEGGVK
jgi:polyferredoxin